MATYNKFYPFVAALANKVHNLGSDQIKLALSNSSPVAANSILSNITEISYTNCSSRNITTTSSAQTGGLYTLVLADLVLLASGGTVGPFRYVVIYNDTAASKDLICWFDYGSSVTLNDTESITIDFSAVSGLLQLT